MLSNSGGSYLTIFPSNNVNLVPRKSRIIPLAHLASGILRTNVRFARSDSFLTLSELTLWNTSPGRYYLKFLFPNSKYKVRKSQRVSGIKSIRKIYKSSKYQKDGHGMKSCLIWAWYWCTHTWAKLKIYWESMNAGKKGVFKYYISMYQTPQNG